MDLTYFTRIIAISGSVLGLAGILMRLRQIMERPFKRDLSRERGSTRRGILYAFTLGMAPWEKESTRTHWIAYIRGILFHVGVFTAFGVVFASPWLYLIPFPIRLAAMLVTGAGALFGFAGIAIRLSGENERALSLPDDYFAVFLTSLFTALAFPVLLYSGWLPAFYLVFALLMIYVPFGKIRHCVYFFYSKFFFGLGFGHRGVIGQSKGKYAE